MKKISRLSVFNSLNDWVDKTTKLMSSYRKAIIECNYKNKEQYLIFLDSIEIPIIFCLEDEKTISYRIKGQKIIRTLKDMGGIWNPPITLSPSEKGKLTSISAIYSGKKQEAVKITASKRRMEDGSYKGTKESIETRESRYNWSEIATKTANTRRNGDKYRNIPWKLTVEKIKVLLSKKNENYTLLSETYLGNKIKLKFLCNKGHYFEMRWNSIASGQKCPKCTNFVQEDKVREIVERVFNEKFVKIRPEWLMNPNTNRRLELDGYCEKIKVAFEYDGEFHYKVRHMSWWKESVDKTREKDKVKDILCKKEGVFLIRVSYRVKDREKYIRKQHLKWLKLYQEKK